MNESNQTFAGMTRYRWVVWSMLCLASDSNYMDRQVLSLTWKEFISPEFGWNDTDYGLITGCFSIVYAIAMLILAAYKVQYAVDILSLSSIRWYFPAISAALAVVLALFILLNPNTAMNIVWGFMGVSIILEAGLEIATIILLK